MVTPRVSVAKIRHRNSVLLGDGIPESGDAGSFDLRVVVSSKKWVKLSFKKEKNILAECYLVGFK